MRTKNYTQAFSSPSGSGGGWTWSFRLVRGHWWRAAGWGVVVTGFPCQSSRMFVFAKAKSRFTAPMPAEYVSDQKTLFRLHSKKRTPKGGQSDLVVHVVIPSVCSTHQLFVPFFVVIFFVSANGIIQTNPP